MLALIKPLVLTSLKSDKFKKFVVDLLEKLVESTDNELDDRALQIVKKGLDIERAYTRTLTDVSVQV